MKRIAAILILLTCVAGAAARPHPLKDIKDRTHILRDIVIESSETANVVQCFACNVYVRGHATGDIVTVGGSIFVEGAVDGDAVAVGGGIEVRPGSKLTGGAIAIGGRVKRSGNGVIGSDSVSIPYAIVPGQYWPTLQGSSLLSALNLLCVGIAYTVLRAQRVEYTSDTIRFRTAVAVFAGVAALFVAWGLESLGKHMGRAEGTADIMLGVLVLMIAAAGAAGLGRRVGSIVSPKMSPLNSTLMGILALSFLELVPLFGFLVFAVGLLFSLGAALVSRLGSRGFPAPVTSPY
jgi:hypothetical protein